MVERSPPSLREAALLGLCPRCGAKTLFDGPIRFAEHCRACALDFSKFNVGDGPAAFKKLLAMKIIARPLLGYNLPEWLRITVGTMEQNEKCIAALKKALS